MLPMLGTVGLLLLPTKENVQLLAKIISLMTLFKKIELKMLGAIYNMAV
jgi:hypothetical protein